MLEATALLERRHCVPDGALLDWADLAQLVEPPASITVRQLQEHWHCSQSQVSRRLTALHRAGLADITPGWGRYRIWEIAA